MDNSKRSNSHLHSVTKFIRLPESKRSQSQIIATILLILISIAVIGIIANFSLDFVRDLRENQNLERVPSVRASLGLYERAQANALLNNRKEVNMDDVFEAFNSVVAHRIRLKPSIRYLTNTKEFIEKEFKKFREDSKSGDIKVP